MLATIAPQWLNAATIVCGKLGLSFIRNSKSTLSVSDIFCTLVIVVYVASTQYETGNHLLEPKKDSCVAIFSEIGIQKSW